MKGRCHCGAVKYRLTAELQEVYCCNCRDCQILSGSAYHFLGIIDRGTMEVSGELAEYRNSTDSGFEMSRYFCPACSTPLYIQSTRFPDISMVLVSTLEEPGNIEPDYEIWTRSRYDWVDQPCIHKKYSLGACD